MKNLFAFLHVGADAALWLTWGSLIVGLFTDVSDLTAAVPLLGLSGFVSDLLAKRCRPLRFLGVLPAAVLFCLCHSKGDRLLLIPLAAYYLFLMYRDALEPDPTELYYRFHVLVGAAAAGAVLSIAASRGWGFSCGILSMAAQVFLMRMLRHSEQELKNVRLMALEILLMILIFGAAMLMSSQAFLHGSLTVIRWLYSTFVMPVLIVAVYLLLGVLWCIHWLISKLFVFEELPIQQNPLTDAMEGAQQFLMQDEVTPNPWLTILLRLLGAAAFLFACCLVFRYLRRGGGSWTAAEEKENDLREAAAVPQKADTRPGILDRSPEAKVRRAYAAYCRALTRRGISIALSDTSRSVNHMAAMDQNADAEELRRLYLLARYSASHTLTNEDAKTASMLSRRLRSAKEE